MPRRPTPRRSDEPFLLAMRLLRDEVPSFDVYPFALPAIRSLGELPLDARVTFLVGENGSGKSTLVEAIAVAAGFNPEGGSRDNNFATRRSHSDLHQHVRLVRSTRRPRTGYFLRAESFYNVGTEAEEIAKQMGGSFNAYGGKSPHEQSHGESFLALVNHRFGPDGLYVLDEPEAALSPQRQLALLVAMHHRSGRGRSSSSRPTRPSSWPSRAPGSSASTAPTSRPSSIGRPSITRSRATF